MNQELPGSTRPPDAPSAPALPARLAFCIEPEAARRAQLGDLLSASGWTATICDALDDAASQALPAAFGAGSALDVDLFIVSDAPKSGSLSDLVASIRAQSAAETAPIVVLGEGASVAAADQAFAAGVTEVFSWNEIADFSTYLQSFADESTAELAGRCALVLEDDPIQGFMLQQLLEREGMTVRLFDSISEAFASAQRQAYDLVLADLVLGQGQSGVSFIRRLRQSEGPSAAAAVIAVSGFDDDARRVDALRAGAQSFIAKPIALPELHLHLQRLFTAPGITDVSGLSGVEIPLGAALFERLTEREQLICTLVAAGRRDKQIAQELAISYWTVRTHMARIFRKLRVSNRVGLVSALRAAAAREEVMPEDAAAPSGGLSGNSIIHALPIGTVLTDAFSRILEVNRTYCEITGFSRDELIGQTPRMLRSGLHPPEFYRKLLGSLKKSGTWNGSVWNRSKSGRHYLGRLKIRRLPPGMPQGAAYVGVFSDITEEHVHTERLREQSLQDALTGLANRTLLRNRTEYEIIRARRTGKSLALAFIDLDRFKPVNDRFGHAVGDGVLQEVAARLSARLRGNDTLSRVGGDEFVALLPEVESRAAVLALCQRLGESFHAPFGPRGAYGSLGASIGASLYPEDGKDFESLLECADRDMYRQKRGSEARPAARVGNGSPFAVFADLSESERESDRARLDAALANNEFILLFQPQIELLSGRIVAAESLLRWRNPEHGLLAAAHFIPVAERTGGIARLGGWALSETCAALRRLARAGFPEIRLTVNVSPLQVLRGGDFSSDTLSAINEHAIAAHRLELEISESVFLHNAEQAVATLGALTDKGVAIALDGIGRDYFSPAYLRQLPFRAMKIHRRCVADAMEDPYNDAIVRSSLLLAQGLGIDAIAEGVESEAQLFFLREAGYRYAQGQFIAQPLSLTELIERLGKQEKSLPNQPDPA